MYRMISIVVMLTASAQLADAQGRGATTTRRGDTTVIVNAGPGM